METEVPQRHMEEISHAVISGRENGFGITSRRLSRGESLGQGLALNVCLCSATAAPKREGWLASTLALLEVEKPQVPAMPLLLVDLWLHLGHKKEERKTWPLDEL